MPACCENGPICSCAKRSNTSLDSHTSTTRIPSSVLEVQWEIAPGGMFPEVRPINSMTLSYCSRVAPLKFISIATDTVSPLSFTQSSLRHFTSRWALSAGLLSGGQPHCHLLVVSVVRGHLAGCLEFLPCGLRLRGRRVEVRLDLPEQVLQVIPQLVRRGPSPEPVA